MKLTPLFNRVLIRRQEQLNGLYLPAGIESAGRLQRGVVHAVGEGVRKIKPGDEVYFGLHGTQVDVISFEGVDYIITPVESLLAQVQEDAPSSAEPTVSPV